MQAGGHEFESRILHRAYIAPRERSSLGRVQARYKTKYFKAYGSKLPTHKIFVLQCTLKTAYKKRRSKYLDQDIRGISEHFTSAKAGVLV